MTLVFLLVKVTVALSLGLLAVRLAHRSRAALRHAILAATFGVLLLLPASLTRMPRFGIPIKVADRAANVSPASATPRSFDVQAPAAVRTPPAVAPAQALPSPATSLFVVWVAGFLFTFAPLAAGIRKSSILRHASLPWRLHDPILPDSIPVGIHESLPGPIVCGISRPMILFPPDAQQWRDEDLQRAVLHELEHVRRRDRIWHIASRALCSVYWFHPFVWIAWRRLVLEAEKSCDDAVLSRSDHIAYADQLVALARRMSSAPVSPVLAMAARADLSARVNSLLDPHCVRGRVSARSVAFVAAMAGFLVFSMTAFRLVAAPQTPAPGAAAANAATEFEAVSVKLVDPASEGQHWHENSDGRYTSITGSVHGFILVFYGIRDVQLVNEPAWFGSRLYSIEATTNRLVHDSPEYYRLLRGVLADRFKLRLGDATRDLPVYFLELATRGPKFSELKEGDAVPKFPQPPQGMYARTFTSPEDMLNQFNGRFGAPALADRPVIDRTGLTKRYLMRLETERQRVDASGERLSFPDLASDLQSQLGLRLVSGHAPLHVFTVEHVEEPSPN